MPKKQVEIAALNHEAIQVIGYTNEELLSKPLDSVLPERLSATIAEFVEFKEDKNDLLAVLNKIRNFALKTRDGRELQFTLRVIQGEAIDKNPWFHLVLIDEEKQRQRNTFHHMLQENFKGHETLDERTGLPDRASLIKDLELVSYHVRNKDISASFAVIDINDYEALHMKHEQEICDRVHRHIGQVCKLKLRSEDTVGTLSERMLGVLLVEAAQEPARMVFNRLRWTIGASPLRLSPRLEITVQVNIGFAQIDGTLAPMEILEKCELFVEELRQKVENHIQLVVPRERRQLKDRREKAIPVAVDKRKKNRRKN